MWQSVKILNAFNTLTLKQIFWKLKNFFQKLEYRFLFEALRLKRHHFHTKYDVKTNKMVSTKWTYQKEQSFARNCFIFLKILFQFKNLFYKELIWCTNDPNAHTRTFCKRWSFIWHSFFLWVSLMFLVLVMLPTLCSLTYLNW